MKKNYKTPLALAVGASLIPLASSIAQADSNPFALSELNSAYMITAQAGTDSNHNDKVKDGSCGEGKCGASMMKQHSSSDKKAIEAKCAGNKAPTGSSSATGEVQKPNSNSSGGNK
jgi:uncharacterized low-complexity protein